MSIDNCEFYDPPLDRRNLVTSILCTPVALTFLISPMLMALNLGGEFVLLAASIAGMALSIAFLKRALVVILAFGIVCTFIYFAGTIDMPSHEQGVRHTITMFCGISVLVYFCNFSALLSRSRTFKSFAFFICLLTTCMMPLASMPKNITSGAMIYSLGVLTVIAIADRGKSFLFATVWVSTSIALGFTFEFRAMYVYPIIVLSVMTFSLMFSKKIMYFTLLVAVFGSISMLIWYFGNITTSPIAILISTEIQNLTGRPATSGREWLWPSMLNLVSSSPWLGVGSGVLPRDFLSTDFSSHNYYIQLLMQTGYIGLSCVVVLLTTVWRLLTRNSNVSGAKFSAGVFIMFCLHNSTEVLMFQNAMMVSVPAWIIIGYGIGTSDNRLV